MRSTPWRTKAAARLVAATRASDMDEAVQRYVSGLRQKALQADISAGVAEPPYDPGALARVLGVKDVAARVLNCDGQVRLDPDDGLPIIEFDSRSTRGRKRFTIAHEVGHMVLWELCGGVQKRREMRTGVVLAETEIERLCNKLAVEILAPRSEVKKLWATKPSANLPRRTVAALLEIHRRYDVSLRFAAVRIRELHAPHASVALVNFARREFDWRIGVHPLRVWKAIDDWITDHPEATEGSGSYWEHGRSGVNTRSFWLKRISSDRLLIVQV